MAQLANTFAPVYQRAVYVYRPGVAPEGNVYNDFSILYHDLSRSKGNRSLSFDDSNGAQTITIPAGTYDFAGVTFLGSSDNPTVNVADGGVFTNMPDLNGALTLNSNSNSPVWTVPTASFLFLTIANLANITASGSAPFISVDAASFLIILLESVSSIQSGSAPAIAAAGGVVAYMTDGSSIGQDTFSGAGSLSIYYSAASSSFDSTQTGFSGSVAIVLAETSSQVAYDNGTSMLTADNVQSAIDEINTKFSPVAHNNIAAQTTAQTITSYTPGADGNYRIGGYVTITAVATDVLQMQGTFKDQNGVSRTVTFFPQGVTSANLAVTGEFTFPTIDIRAQASTAIVLKVIFSVGAGSVTYDAGGSIQKVF